MTNEVQEIKKVKDLQLLVPLFLKTRESDIELSKKTGISSSTVGRRLTDKDYIIKAFPDNGEEIYNQIMQLRKDNLHKAKIRGGQTSMLNYIYTKDENGKFKGCTKLRLDVIFDDEEKQMEFLIHLMLTFRVKLSLIEQMFQINKNLLKRKLSEDIKFFDALSYLNFNDETNQEEARENVRYFYKELHNAFKDNIKKNILFNMISDEKINIIKNSNKSIDILSNDEIISILKYQLKYALNNDQLVNEFNMDMEKYRERIQVVLLENELLNQRYNDLMNYCVE